MTHDPQNHDTDSAESNKLPDAQEQQQQEAEDLEQRKLDEAIEMTFPASDPLAI